MRYHAECNAILKYLLEGVNVNNGVWFFENIKEQFPGISTMALDNVIFPKLKVDGYITVSGLHAPSSTTRVQFRLSDEGKVFLAKGGYATSTPKTVKDFIYELLCLLDENQTTIDVEDFVTDFYKTNGIDRSMIGLKMKELVREGTITSIGHEHLTSSGGAVNHQKPSIYASITRLGQTDLERIKVARNQPVVLNEKKIYQSKMTKRIFISHASIDKAKVTPLIDLIESIGIRHNEIFYSSHPAYGINIGERIFDALKSILDNEILALFILSENFYNSPVCLCEMGAVWIKANKQIPILIPPFDFSDVKGVFPNTLGFKINDKDQLNNLKITIEETFQLDPIHPSRWEEKRDEYLAKVNAQLMVAPSKHIPKVNNFQSGQTIMTDNISEFGVPEIDNDPDLKMLLAHFLDKEYMGMSFANIKMYVNPEFTEEYLMKMIKKHPMIIRRGKLRTGDFGVLLMEPQ